MEIQPLNIVGEAVRTPFRAVGSAASTVINLGMLVSNDWQRRRLHESHPQAFADLAGDRPLPAHWRGQPAAGQGPSRPGVHLAGDFLLDEGNRRLFAVSELLGGREVYKTKGDHPEEGPPRSVSVRHHSTQEGRLATFEEAFEIRRYGGPEVSGGSGKGPLGFAVWQSAGPDGRPATRAMFFAGSKLARDWANDAQNILGFGTEQYAQAKKELRDELVALLREPPQRRPKELVVGGHSLGGGLAIAAYSDPENIALVRKLRSEGVAVSVVTRNPAAAPFTSAKAMASALGPDGAGAIVNLVNSGELVSSFGALPGHVVLHGKPLGEAASAKTRAVFDSPFSTVLVRPFALVADKSRPGDILYLKTLSEESELNSKLASAAAKPFAYAVGSLLRHADGSLKENAKPHEYAGRSLEDKLSADLGVSLFAAKPGRAKIAYDMDSRSFRFVPDGEASAKLQAGLRSAVKFNSSALAERRRAADDAPVEPARPQAPSV